MSSISVSVTPQFARRLRTLVATVMLIALVLTNPFAMAPASAQGWGDLIIGIINAAIIQSATKKWEKIDLQVRDCVANKYQGQAAQLAQQGIGPDDRRVAPYVQSCQQIVAQERLQAAQDEQARQAEAARQAQAAEAERAAREAEEAATRAHAAEHHQQMISKYGSGAAADIEGGVVRKGMSRDAVLDALGPPERKEIIPPDAELWTYANQRISIVNGKVTYVGH